MAKEKFVLIDGSSLIFRGFYAIRNLTTKEGIFTNGVYGFLSMYYKIMEDIQPDYICVAFDRSTPTFRHKDYDQYKGNRADTPDELSGQFGILKDILNSMHVSALDVEGFEADDICGTLAKVADEKNIEAILVTGDRDYLQLIDKNISVMLTKKGITDTKLYDVREIYQEFQLSPKQLIDVKGLMGDASDNIPGVPGIGEKTALKYIVQYGSIDGLYEHIDEISGKKTKERLIDNKDLAYMSKNLGTIVTHAPVETDLEHYRVKEPDYDMLREKYERLEFRNFLKKLPSEESKRISEYDYQEATEQDCEKILETIRKDKSFVFHFFYEDDYHINNIEYITVLSDKTYIFPYDKQILEAFRPVFSDRDIQKISYDIKSDIFYLLQHGISIEMPYEDLTIAEYLIDPSKSSYEIEKSSLAFLEEDMITQDSLLGKGSKKIAWSELDAAKRNLYFASYLNVTRSLREKLLEIIVARNMEDLYFLVELPLVNVLAHMEREGIIVDKDYLLETGKLFDTELQELEESMYEMAGSEFNINSTKQLGEVLFEKLELPVIKKTKTGYSTAQDVLEKLENAHPIIEKILRYRKIKKLSSTYIEGMIKLIREDGKIHSHFNQTIAATGRISSTDPNLQNIPIREEEGRLIRKAFLASENSVLTDGDYSQIELRVLAHLSNDKAMLEAFEHDADIHRKTAAEVFHVSFDEVTDRQRSNAKAVNFGIVYGISDYGLSQDLNITRKEAKQYIDSYLDTYTGIKSYMQDIVASGKEQGFVETIMHRRRYIPELTSKNFNIRGFGERVALNTPIQGSAADIIKIAMVNVFHRLQSEKKKSKLILQVHDELIIDTAKDEIDDVKNILLEEMENAVALKVRLKVDIHTGKNWYESK